MKDLSQLDAVLIGFALAMIFFFLFWLSINSIILFIEWVLDKFENWQYKFKRNRWRKKHNLPKI